jgi:prepilin-type N-terminal cleavage/methylation domain-containing protein
MSVTRTTRGFSLVEVLVAASILAAAVAATTATLMVVLKGERGVERRTSLEAAVDLECQRLRGLPYYRCSTSPPGTTPTPPSVLGDVFPHACVECNTAQSRYEEVGPGGDPGFVSSIRVAGECVYRRATFATVLDRVTQPVPAVMVNRWTVWSGAIPPGPWLELSVWASRAGCTVTRHVELVCVPPSVEPWAAALAIPGGSDAS